LIDRVNNTWDGADIEILFAEFQAFNAEQGIGPGINWLIDQGYTTNKGRSKFHIRKLRDRFYQELATDYVARLQESKLALVAGS